MAVIAFILFIITMVFLVLAIENSNKIDPLELETMTHEQIIQRVYDAQNGISLSFILPIFGFFSVFIGALVYYLLSENRENVGSVNIQDYTSGNGQGISINILRRALSHDERKVFDLLLSRNGMLMQSEVSSIEGFNKVKAHRTVDQLENKGIITKTSAGKQRVIRFVNDLEEVLSEKRNDFKNNDDGLTK